MEEVRRELIKQFGETAEDGPNSLYAGGLWVRTSMVPTMQDAAAQALRDGLARFDGGRGWRDPGLSVDLAKAIGPPSSTARRSASAIPTGRRRSCCRRTAARRRSASPTARPAALPARRASMPERGVGGAAFDALKPGMVVIVKASAPGSYGLRSVPGCPAGCWSRRSTPAASSRCRAAGRRGSSSTGRPRRSASPARHSSRSSTRPRWTTA